MFWRMSRCHAHGGVCDESQCVECDPECQVQDDYAWARMLALGIAIGTVVGFLAATAVTVAMLMPQ